MPDPKVTETSESPSFGPIVNLFVLKEAFHSEKMEGVIPESMTFAEYCVRQAAGR